MADLVSRLFVFMLLLLIPLLDILKLKRGGVGEARIRFVKERLLFALHRIGFAGVIVLLIDWPALQILSLIVLYFLFLFIQMKVNIYSKLGEKLFQYLEKIFFMIYLVVLGWMHYYNWKDRVGSYKLFVDLSAALLILIIASIAISIGFPLISMFKDCITHT